MANTRRRWLWLARTALAAAVGLCPEAMAQTSSTPAATPTPTPATASSPAASSVTLKVRVKGSGVPIAHAEVTLPDGKKQFTDKKGELILALPARDGQVKIYRSGQETEMLDIAELRGKGSVDVFMLPATPSDNEVVVRGEKRPEASRKTITIAEAVKVGPRRRSRADSQAAAGRAVAVVFAGYRRAWLRP